PDAIVVSALEDALELRAREDVAVVTLDGEALRGTMVEGGRGVKGLLAPRREVKEVAARQEQVEALLAARRAEAAAAPAAGGARGRGGGGAASSRSTPRRRSGWRRATSCRRPTTRRGDCSASARCSTRSAHRRSG